MPPRGIFSNTGGEASAIYRVTRRLLGSAGVMHADELFIGRISDTNGRRAQPLSFATTICPTSPNIIIYIGSSGKTHDRATISARRAGEYGGEVAYFGSPYSGVIYATGHHGDISPGLF